MKLSGEAVFARAPVIPVITIDDAEVAVPLARALVAGGISVLEITLRTSHGLEAIRRIREQVPEALVGAGTVLHQQDLERALAAGSQFVITPGLTPELLAAGAHCGVPFMPGVATVSEMMQCLDAGLHALKFFPAQAMGGAPVLKAFGGPFPEVVFCPTGGITPANLADYLAVPAVKTVGGSWLTPDALVRARDWKAVKGLAEEACALVARLRNTQ